MKYLHTPIAHLFVYGFLLAAFVGILKWLQWKYLIADYSVEFYIGAVALLFTVLGGWMAHALLPAPTPPIIIEKEVPVPMAMQPSFNNTQWERLQLTPREDDVLQLLVKGYSNAEIGEALFLSVSTIKTHVSNLFIKLEVTSRLKAIEKAKQLQVIKE